MKTKNPRQMARVLKKVAFQAKAAGSRTAHKHAELRSNNQAEGRVSPD
jgi:hypothetical protein